MKDTISEDLEKHICLSLESLKVRNQCTRPLRDNVTWYKGTEVVPAWIIFRFTWCYLFGCCQDAANLLAVQNSELLRRLALTLLTAAAGGGGDGRGERRSELPLLSLPGVLQSVRREVGGARQDLQWSCDFHKNHLFG